MKEINFNFLNYIKPNHFIQSIDEINITNLKKNGIKYIFCDLDNTLVPHYTKLPTKSCINFAKNISKNKMKLIVISNNNKKRVELFCDYLNISDFIYKAKKPFVYKIKRIIKKYNIDTDDVVFIGDQFITDIWVANRLKIKSILVLPILDSLNKTNNNWFVNLLEKKIYRYLSKENILNNRNNNDMINDRYDYI